MPVEFGELPMSENEIEQLAVKKIINELKVQPGVWAKCFRYEPGNFSLKYALERELSNWYNSSYMDVLQIRGDWVWARYLEPKPKEQGFFSKLFNWERK